MKMVVTVNFCLREGEVPGKACRDEMGHWIKHTRGQGRSQTTTAWFGRVERQSRDGVQQEKEWEPGAQKIQDFKSGIEGTFTTTA